MLSFAAATAVLTGTRYVAVSGRVSPATVRFIMGEGKVIRETEETERSHLAASSEKEAELSGRS